MSLYYVGLMGTAPDAVIRGLSATLRHYLALLGLDNELVIVSPDQLFDPPGDFAAVGVFFGALGVNANSAALMQLMASGVPILPVVSDEKSFNDEIPACLHAINGLVLNPKDVACDVLAGSILEILGLLPSQRRVFLSYRRSESREAALQLFEHLSSRHFEVFVDTHGVPPGADFQEVLWHRLSDSDALVMLDTPGYFKSRWTSMEFGKALAKDLIPVRLGWPGVSQDPHSLSGESIQFGPADFEANGLTLTQDALGRSALAVERARSRGIALRSITMISALSFAARRVGGKLLGLGPKRTAIVEVRGGHRVLVFPSVGVPTAEHLHQVSILDCKSDSRAVLYDDAGIDHRWHAHLQWLGSQVKSAKWLRLGQAKWMLSTWAEEHA